MDFQQINDLTGFANGDKFTSEDEVLLYFTVENMVDMFGIDNILAQDQLDDMAEEVLSNRWHCLPFEDDEYDIEIEDNDPYKSIPYLMVDEWEDNDNNDEVRNE